MKLSRRAFVKTTAMASAMAMPAISYGRVMGTNDKIRVAVVGVNSRGNKHVEGMKKNVVAICDCDENILGRVADPLNAQKFIDYRKLCDSNEIDAISVATPNHTHSLISITAMLAGKDVYCEKPVSHNVWEGRQLAECAARTKRICQCGTQSRSSTALQAAVKAVRDGEFGKIQYAIGTCYKPRRSIGKLDKPLAIPDNVNYDLWCGPAEKRALFRPELHYDWHWDFNTGNGDMGNQGIHQMDIARWFLGCEGISPRVRSIGGRVGYDDAADTPNSQTVIHDYPDAPLIFETRGLPRGKEFQDPERWARNMDQYRGSKIGVIVQCENAYVVSTQKYSQAAVFDNEGRQIQMWEGKLNPYENFLEAVQAQDTTLLNAPIVEGHISSALCHMGGMSHRLGEKATGQEIAAALEPESDRFKDSFARLSKHLKDNGIDIETEKTLTLGADLKFDVENETVLNNDKATPLLSREYRPGFEVPNMKMKAAG